MKKIIKPPNREAFGKEEIESINECIQYYQDIKADPPYDGVFQKRFEQEFSRKMGGGYSLAVSSGSTASFLALKSLELPKGSTVLMSPVTDTSTLCSILLCDLKPVIVDTKCSSYNSSLTQFMEAFSKDVSAIYLVHTYGVPADIQKVVDFCKKNKIKLIEDCSQSPFAYLSTKDGKKYLGSFGDVSAFSTMYRKTIHTSSSGGIVFTKDKNLYNVLTEYSDRGRPKWSSDYNPREPGEVSRIGHNCNTSEIACAIGLASLKRIDKAIKIRFELMRYLYSSISSTNCKSFLKGMEFPDGSSPFLIPIIITNDKRNIVFKSLSEYQIPFAETYNCFAFDWKISRLKIKQNLLTFIKRRGHKSIYNKNAIQVKKNTFNLFLHEGYTKEYVEYIVESLNCL